MRRDQCTFRPNNKEERHILVIVLAGDCWTLYAMMSFL